MESWPLVPGGPGAGETVGRAWGRSFYFDLKSRWWSRRKRSSMVHVDITVSAKSCSCFALPSAETVNSFGILMIIFLLFCDCKELYSWEVPVWYSEDYCYGFFLCVWNSVKNRKGERKRWGETNVEGEEEGGEGKGKKGERDIWIDRHGPKYISISDLIFRLSFCWKILLIPETNWRKDGQVDWHLLDVKWHCFSYVI